MAGMVRGCDIEVRIVLTFEYIVVLFIVGVSYRYVADPQSQ